MVSPFLPRPTRLLLALVLLTAPLALHAADKLSQPVAPVRPVTDTYFGTPVIDNYRWMEDLKSPEVQAWMKGQAAYTKDYLSKLPGRDALVKRIESLDNASTRVAGVALCGTRYFYEKLTPKDPNAEALRPRQPDRPGTAPCRSASPRRRRQALHHQRILSLPTMASTSRSKLRPAVRKKASCASSTPPPAKTLPDAIDRVWGAGVNWSAR